MPRVDRQSRKALGVKAQKVLWSWWSLDFSSKLAGIQWKVLTKGGGCGGGAEKYRKLASQTQQVHNQLLIFLPAYPFIYLPFLNRSHSFLPIAQVRALQLPWIPLSPTPCSILPLEALVAAVLFSRVLPTI